MYISPSFNTVTPYFFAKDAESFITFLVQGLGGVEICHSMRPNGLVQNVVIQLGSSALMISEATEKYPGMCVQRLLYLCRKCGSFNAARPKTRRSARNRRARHALW